MQAFLQKHLIRKTWKRKRQTLCRNLELIIRTASHLRFPLRNEHLDVWFRPVQQWHDLVERPPDVPTKYPERWPRHFLHVACAAMDPPEGSGYVLSRTCAAIKSLFRAKGRYVPRYGVILRAALELVEWCEGAELKLEVLPESIRKLRYELVYLCMPAIIEAAQSHCRSLSKIHQVDNRRLTQKVPIAA